MTAFASAVGAIFRDPNISVAAIYKQGGAGEGISVRVIKRAPDAESQFNGGRFVSAAAYVDVRMSEVPALASGDTFTIGSEILEVLGEPRRDGERLVWMAEARYAV